MDLALKSDPALQIAGARALRKENPFAALEKLEELDQSLKKAAYRRQLIAALGDWPDNKAVPLLKGMVSALQKSDGIAKELRLDVIEAAKARPEKEFNQLVDSYEAKFDKSDPLSAWRDTELGGDPIEGQRIFTQHSTAQCARCHRVGGEGSDFGPDLADIAARLDSGKLLESLINPSAVIAEGYELVTIVTNSDETIGGTIRMETDKLIEIVQQDGSVKKVSKTEIKDRTSVAVSTMPPMGAILTKMEIRDVLAYLRTLRQTQAKAKQ